MKRKELKPGKIVVIAAASILAGILLLIVGCSICNNLPDYLFDDNIPKGYVDTDGYNYAGKDLDEYFWYKYDEKQDFFEKSEKYTVVDKNNIEELKTAVAYYEEWAEAKFSYEISYGDYFMIIYHNQDGDVIDYRRETNVMLYFYDVDTNTLHYFYYVI